MLLTPALIRSVVTLLAIVSLSTPSAAQKKDKAKPEPQPTYAVVDSSPVAKVLTPIGVPVILEHGGLLFTMPFSRERLGAPGLPNVFFQAEDCSDVPTLPWGYSDPLMATAVGIVNNNAYVYNPDTSRAWDGVTLARQGSVSEEGVVTRCIPIEPWLRTVPYRFAEPRIVPMDSFVYLPPFRVVRQ